MSPAKQTQGWTKSVLGGLRRHVHKLDLQTLRWAISLACRLNSERCQLLVEAAKMKRQTEMRVPTKLLLRVVKLFDARSTIFLRNITS